MDGINDLEYKELRLDLVDLTEGVVGSFLFYYDEEVKKIYELPPQKRGAELRKLANRIPYVAGVSVDTTQSNGFASKDNPDPDTRAWKQSQITYTDGLKAGDMVLVQKLNDNNKYVIIARVVEA